MCGFQSFSVLKRPCLSPFLGLNQRLVNLGLLLVAQVLESFKSGDLFFFFFFVSLEKREGKMPRAASQG